MHFKTLMFASLIAASQTLLALDAENLQIGPQKDGSILVPTNQKLTPAGAQVTFPGRPVDIVFSADGKTLIVKNTGDLVFIDVARAKIIGALPLNGKLIGENITQGKIFEGMSVTGLINAGDKIYVSDASNSIRVAERHADGTFGWSKPIALPAPTIGGSVHPAGMALAGNGILWVTSTRGNCVHAVDTKTNTAVATVPVGIAPFTICFTSPEKAYVSNWGGEAPKENDPQAKTSGTFARIDPRTSVVNSGSVSVLTQTGGKWSRVKSIEVGLHPCALLTSATGKLIYVANANSDTISVIDSATDAVVETINCRPNARMPFGSGANALALSADGLQLCVANATNNCVSVVTLGVKALEKPTADSPKDSSVAGQIPVGWYPSGVQFSPDGKKLCVCNLKGHGLFAEIREKEKGHNSHDYLGSVSIIDTPDAAALAALSLKANDNIRLAHALAGLEAPRPDAKPVPIPERHGEPSTFKHVIYIIKENKTYDQIFGDMAEGDGDKNLCIFPEKVTPNTHALARTFTLFDNFYCSGSKSPDGHAWVDQAYVTDYLERSYGGFTRSYPYEGSDPLAFASTGFIWDNALAHGKTFRNYGEFCRTTYTPKATWKDVYADYQNNTAKIKIAAEPNLQSLKPHTHPSYPGFPLHTPDIMRARMFIDELKQFEQKGEMPNLMIVFLPQDHTSGTSPSYPTPRAMVADNDLGLGQVIEAISKSKFWPQTCIFAVEDDPQSGYDHVDGHRTVALVASPYTKRKFVDHTNYSQPGMVKTIELILGLPPMTQLDLSAPAMRSCFQSDPDLAPYTAVPAQIALDEMNPPLKKLKGAALDWAKKSLELSFDKEDEADDDTLNRIVWHSVKGDAPYPAQFVKVSKDDDDDDDDKGKK